MTAAELFDAANNAKGLKDADLARLLKISKPSLSIFRHGKAPLPDRLIVELAEMAGLDPAAILPAVNATKETRSVHVRAVWEEVAKRAKNRPPPSQADEIPRECILCKVTSRGRIRRKSRFSRYKTAA